MNNKKTLLELWKIQDKKYIAVVYLKGECLGVSIEEGEPIKIKERLKTIYNIRELNKQQGV